MAKYGEPLDNDYDPVRETVYPIFVEYFNNPLMSKLKDVDNYSVYICKIHALLGIEYRYLFVFVYPDNIPLGTQINLSKLYWVSLQTRSLQEEHTLQSHSYIPRRLKQMDRKIHIEYKDTEQYIYNVEQLPLVVTLLPKTKNYMEYNDHGSLISAIETYQTIISFKN